MNITVCFWFSFLFYPILFTRKLFKVELIVPHIHNSLKLRELLQKPYHNLHSCYSGSLIC